MKISTEIKLGSILFNNERNQVEIVTLQVLKELLDLEGRGDQKKFSLLNIIDSWLEDFFGFKKIPNKPHAMEVYIHTENGFRLHKRKGRRFQLGYSIREKHRSLSGEIYFLNELDDFMFLLTRERLVINEALIKRINTEGVGEP